MNSGHSSTPPSRMMPRVSATTRVSACRSRSTMGSIELRALLLGDLSYPIIKRIFEVSEEDDLAWNVLLAPHHCSKAVMYWKDEGDER